MKRNDMQIRSVNVWVVEVPQIAPIAPYRSHVRSSSVTQSAIVRVDTSEGITGWGEHNVNFLPDISASRMQATARDWLVGRDPLNIAAFHQDCPFESRLKSGVELALWDIRGKAAGLSVAELLGGVIRPRISLAACMGIQNYQRAGEIAAWCVEQGYSTLKTKAGADMDEDVEMVRGIRDAVGDRLKLRIDPNRSYLLADAVELCHRIEEYNLEYIEQPIAAEPLSEAVELRRDTNVPLALNESVTDPSSVMQILREDAAEFLLPDTHIAGGIQPCVIIGRLCEAAGIPSIMHCGHDLGPKTAAMLHVASACPAYSLANDSTYYGLENDILTEPFRIDGGTIMVPASPGLGCDVDVDMLRRYQIDC
ncbi:MAG: mandelate racemase/muconate lactonizing enzyme family protein [Fuerstiella sp.]|nr:mandelate racemase/muconate lactonizing enzyme family protein [Fuerstiella sp.]